MDSTAGIVNMKHAQLMGQVQMRVAKKMLDMQEMQGAAAIQLIEAAGKIVTSAGDELVAAATGLGGAIDAYA